MSNILNFSTDNLITGINILDGQLFWTDDRNEPRKINIDKFKDISIGGEADHTGNVTSIYGRTLLPEDITVIRPGPTEAITIVNIADGVNPNAQVSGDDLPDGINGLGPDVVALEPVNVTHNSAIYRATSASNGLPILERGFYVGLQTDRASIVNNNSPIQAFTDSETDFRIGSGPLLSNITYNYVAYARNSAGTSVSDNVVSFMTKTGGTPLSFIRGDVETGRASSVTSRSATLNGTLVRPSGGDISEAGFYFGTDISLSALQVPANRITVFDNVNDFVTPIASIRTNLEVNTTYNYVAYAIVTTADGSEEITGDIVSFPTRQSRVPSLVLNPFNVIFLDQALLGATISDDGGGAIEEYGFIVSDTVATQAGLAELLGNSNNDYPASGLSNDIFTRLVRELDIGTTYNYIAYARNSVVDSIGFSEPSRFTTEGPPSEQGCGEPGVISGIRNLVNSTSSFNLIHQTTHSGGTGCGTIVERGVYFGTQSTREELIANNEPIVNGFNQIQSPDGIGSYGSNHSNLSSNRLYYWVAYAVNGNGVTGYGNVESGRTASSSEIPSLNLPRASNPGSTTQTFTSNVYQSIGSNPTGAGGFMYAEGFNLNEATIRAANNNVPVTGIVLGTDFTADVTGLDTDTQYSFFAYASNSAGEGISQINGFRTLPAASLAVRPTVTTNTYNEPDPTRLINLGAGLRGGLTSDGGAEITSWGFRYSTTNPNGSVATLRMDSGAVNVDADLDPFYFLGAVVPTFNYNTYTPEFVNGTTYYYVAWAINTSSATPSYGGVMSFTPSTLINLGVTTLIPTSNNVTTGTISNRSQTTATLNGVFEPAQGVAAGLNTFYYSETESTSAGLIANGTSVTTARRGINMADIDGLSPNTEYNYIAVLHVAGLVSFDITGSVRSFNTLAYQANQINSVTPSVINTQASVLPATSTTTGINTSANVPMCVDVSITPTGAGFTIENNSRTNVTQLGNRLLLENMEEGEITITHGRNESIKSRIILV